MKEVRLILDTCSWWLPPNHLNVLSTFWQLSILWVLDQHFIEERDPYFLDFQTATGGLTCWCPTACKQVTGVDCSTSGSPGAAHGAPCPHSGVVRQQEGFYTRRTLSTSWHCLQLCCSQTYLWSLLVLKTPGLPTTFTNPFLLWQAGTGSLLGSLFGPYKVWMQSGSGTPGHAREIVLSEGTFPGPYLLLQSSSQSVLEGSGELIQ